MQNIKNYFLTPVAACLCAGFTVSAQAQVLTELELRQEGADAVAVVYFVTPVQYTKSISARASDLVQAFYTVLPTSENLSLAPGERRLPGGGDIPSIVVRDESANAAMATGAKNRKLVVRFDKPAQFKVRSGRNGNSIEIVLIGLGASVPLAPIKTTALPKSPTAVPAQSGALTSSIPTDVDMSAAALLATAQSQFDGGQYDAATESLNKLLNLPPNNSSRKAQELAGLARLNAGDKARAINEFELFLKLYPEGADSDRIKQLLAGLPAVSTTVAQAEDKPAEVAKGVTSGSVSMFYYGGKTADQTRQEAYDASGIRLVTDAVPTALSDQKQLQTSVDLAWRLRDAEKDMRFVVRDSLTNDFVKTKDKNKERLTALYFDYKSLALGTSVRVGRQSPTGGGVMYRFDGVQAGYGFKPKWKINVVAGTPSEDLVDTKRSFYGASLDAEALTKELSGSAFIIEQKIDGETDRRGIGADLRYFKGGLSASAQFDYDQILKKLNVAAFQSTWQMSEVTSINTMLDRRASPILSLGNAIFYQYDVNGVPLPFATRLQDRLDVFPIAALRQRVIDETPYQSQFQIGATRILTANWQTGLNFSVSSMDAIPDFVFEGQTIAGQAATGNQWGVSAQLIGTNLYSARDTHVFNVSFSGGLTDHSTQLSYNNLTSLGDKWQIEPSLRYNTMSSTLSGNSDTWSAGVRGIYRVRSQISLESELTYERRTNVGLPVTDVGGNVTRSDTVTNGVTYYLGARYEF